MKAKLELESGVVSATVPALGYMDAAVVGELGGLELAVEHVRVTSEGAPSYRADPIVVLAMTPDTMRTLAILLAEKTGMPLLNEREWRNVVGALNATATPGAVFDGRELADRIEQSLGS